MSNTDMVWILIGFIFMFFILLLAIGAVVSLAGEIKSKLRFITHA